MVMFLVLHLMEYIVGKPNFSDQFKKIDKRYIRVDFDFEIVNFPFLDGDVPRSTSYGVYIVGKPNFSDQFKKILKRYIRVDFDFEIVNFPFLDGEVPRSTSYGVYIFQLIRFARASSYVADFNTRNKLLTQKLLKQVYQYHKLRKTFSKFYRRYYDLISKFQVGLKSLLRQGLSEPDFYGDLVYKLKKIVGSNNFPAQFIKIISHYKKMATTLMYCNRLHAWWSTQSRLATLLSSLIARRWVGLQTL